MPRLAAIAVVVLSAAPLSARAAGLRGQATISLAPGYDTNPRRTVGDPPEPDADLALSATARGRIALDEVHALGGKLEAGAKKFWRERGEDVAAAQASAGYSAQLGRWLLGAEASGKLRRSRSADRDYQDAGVEGYVDWLATDALGIRTAAGARRFVYPPDRAYSSTGPTGSAALRWTLSRRHLVSLAATTAWPLYDGTARLTNGEPGTDRRKDILWGGQVAYAYRGPVSLQAGYALGWTLSNSFGERSQRHRLSAAASGRLPLGLFGMAQVAWQLVHYPDGIFLSQDLMLLDEESQSSILAKLAWPLCEELDLEARYGFYWIELPRTAVFRRHTGMLGLALRW